MASTLQADALTAAHRAVQARNAAVVAALVALLWRRMVDPDDIDASAARWLKLVLPRILTARGNAEGLARRYVTDLRRLELPAMVPFVPTPLELMDPNILRTSLWVTGPEALTKRLEKVSGADITDAERIALLDEAFQMSGDGAASAVLRHTSGGGRDQVMAAAKEDRVALGWARVTKDDPCFFCAMLSGRGIVYQDDSFEHSNSLFTGDGIAKAHDNCACSLEPTYSRTAKAPGRSDEFGALWGSSTKGKSGHAAILAFRNAYEGR